MCPPILYFRVHKKGHTENIRSKMVGNVSTVVSLNKETCISQKWSTYLQFLNLFLAH